MHRSPSRPGNPLTRADLYLVEHAATSADELQRSAEHTMMRGVVIGTVVGVALVGFGPALAGPLWMGVAVGVFGGSFLGGWAGVVATTPALERAEETQKG